MRNKAVFLDRDGTINVEKNYLYEIDKFEFLPGVLEGLRRLKDAGCDLIIVTNQSGIARGYYTEAQYQELEDWMLRQLKEAGAEITAAYHCPHLPDAQVMEYRKDCDCRKPKLGMFYQAIETYQIDVSKSFAIGDKMRDLELCRQTDAKGFLVYSEKDYYTEQDKIHCIEGGIGEAVEEILNKEKGD